MGNTAYLSREMRLEASGEGGARLHFPGGVGSLSFFSFLSSWR